MPAFSIFTDVFASKSLVGFILALPFIMMSEQILQPFSNSNSFHQRLSGIMVKTITNTILTGSVFTFRWNNYYHNYFYQDLLAVKVLLDYLRPMIIRSGMIRDTPLCHIDVLNYAPNYAKYGQICILAHIWARQLWPSGAFLKRSYKMQFRCFGLRSIGPSSQEL